MKKIILLFAVTLFISGCAGIPSPVEDRFLIDTNEKEAALIRDIEQKIITKNREKQAVENKLKEISPAPGITEDELKLMEKENTLLKDQIDFYTKTKDAVTLESKKNQLKTNEADIAKKRAQYNSQKAEKEMTEAELEVKSNELAVAIAQLNYEKAKIASAYRDKNEESPDNDSGNFITKLFKNKDPEDKYGYKKYDEYYKNQQDELAKSEKKFLEAEKKFQDARAKLQGKK